VSLRGAGDGSGGAGAVLHPLLVRTPAASVVVLHGTGGSGDNWSYLALALSLLRLNAVRWVLPTAPARAGAASAPRRPSWFRVLGVTEGAPEDEANIVAASRRVAGLVAAEVDRGVPADRVFVLGFSQGGAVALTHALRSRVRVGGTVVLSGWLPLRKRYPEAVHAANAESPILMLHVRWGVGRGGGHRRWGLGSTCWVFVAANLSGRHWQQRIEKRGRSYTWDSILTCLTFLVRHRL